MAHIHTVNDSGPHFLINPTTRKITYDSNQKLVLMQYDQNSEEATFEMPRYIDGHDTMLCNSVRAHYVNIGSSGDRYADLHDILDMRIKDGDEETIVFTWLFEPGCTKYAGTLNFVIRFQCIEDGLITYSWGTDVYKDIRVRNSLNNGDEVAVENSDILTQWKTDIDSKLNEMNAKLDEHIASFEDASEVAM